MDNEATETPAITAIPKVSKPKKPRRKTFAVPLTADEHEVFSLAAQAQGMPIATYIRRAALWAARAELKNVGMDVSQILQKVV